ncbi:hypothetical protein [Blastochloris viridis]|uniref:hypothetical protein n=1 Tax=Blastochloris viridis TaxID=1079 RepID=UPI0006D7B2A1|nr:hypothetical protein [Blastochloris viridis]
MPALVAGVRFYDHVPPDLVDANGVAELQMMDQAIWAVDHHTDPRGIVTGIRVRSGRCPIGSAAGKITRVPSLPICPDPHPRKQSAVALSGEQMLCCGAA